MKPLRKRSALGKPFLRRLQRRVAIIAVNASSARNMGRPGTIDRARSFLARKIRLHTLPAEDARSFEKRLDALTINFAASAGLKWGSARKLLNLFLRDCVYTCYLRTGYGLVKLERLLEIPVDSQVARQLKHECKALPSWRGVKNLRAEENREYQRVAAGIAAHKGISRVHLDIWYWRAEKGAE